MIFVDSSVLLDLVTNDPVWKTWSLDTLSWAAAQDRLAINDPAYAELSVKFEHMDLLDEMIAELELLHPQIPKGALFMAGKAQLGYRRGGGSRTGVLPDFFIGAHAVYENAPLITRDPGRVRAYFPALELIAPDR